MDEPGQVAGAGHRVATHWGNPFPMEARQRAALGPKLGILDYLRALVDPGHLNRRRLEWRYEQAELRRQQQEEVRRQHYMQVGMQAAEGSQPPEGARRKGAAAARERESGTRYGRSRRPVEQT